MVKKCQKHVYVICEGSLIELQSLIKHEQHSYLNNIMVGTLPRNYFLTHVTPSECGLLTKLIGMINQRSFREQILSSKSCQ